MEKSAQLIDVIRSVSIKSLRARSYLLEIGFININNNKIDLHDEYPITFQRIYTVKIIFKNLPFHVPDQTLFDYNIFIPSLMLKLKLNIYARLRNEERELTPFESGDRFLYVRTGFKRTMPNVADINHYKCRIQSIPITGKCLLQMSISRAQ